MSRHEGVSCDSCLKSNFIGRRYKCLICYDYDLCADCYEEGATSTRHLVDHPMQCILTRSDIDLYYGGEMLNSEQPQSFTCPYCKKMGFSDSSLLEHVGTEHTDTGLEVVCPVCAGQPGGDPNLVTDDFAGHLTLEHRSGPRDLISFLPPGISIPLLECRESKPDRVSVICMRHLICLSAAHPGIFPYEIVGTETGQDHTSRTDEPSAIRHGGVRRIPGRALGGPRSRRSNMHFSSSGLSALSPSGRESVDPIAELLSQLSGVRRGTSQPSQLQQLQMQMQMERQATNRQQLERLPRRQAHAVVTSNANNSVQDVVASGSSSIGAAPNNINANGIISSSSGQQSQTNIVVSSINTRDAPLNSSSFPLSVTSVGLTTLQGNNLNDGQSQFLLSRFMSPSLDESDLSLLEKDRADRSQYVQALILSTLSSIQIKNTTKSEKRGESQETNSDNVNSETNNDSGDDKDDSNVKRGCTGEIVRDGDVSFNIGVAETDNRQQGFDGEFLEEYTLQQQQNFCSSGNKKKMSGAAGSKSNISQNTAILLERRGRPPPSGNSSQQEKTNRDLKSNTLSTKEIPDSR